MTNVIPLPIRARQEPVTDNDEVSTASILDVRSVVYSVPEVAQLLSIGRGMAYAMVRSGEIPARRFRTRWVIPRKAFHEWIDNLPEASTEDLERGCARLDRQERREAKN